MLQFWKKPKALLKADDRNVSAPIPQPPKTEPEIIKQTPKVPPLNNFEDEGLCDIDDFEKSKSKLAKTLQEVLFDKSAFTYFMQFLESRKAGKYLTCWLDIDDFKSSLYRKKKTQKVDHDSLSVSTDCDSIETSSLCDSATQSEISESSPRKTEDSSEDKSQLVENAVGIFKKYIAQEATHLIKCPESIRNEIIEDICDTEKVLSGKCFKKIQELVYEVLEKEYFEAFLASDHFCKYQIDILTSGQVALDDIIQNETALFYFMEFLEQENTCSLLEFWIAATNLQQHLKNQKEFFDPIEAQSDAVVLYDKYFSLQAHCPLGFSDKVRFEIEQNICGENGLVIDCFNLPLKIVEQILEKQYLKPFLASQLFYKYLSELINTVQNEFSMNFESRRTLSSDCSSEKSFSTNTFLALEINGGARKKDRCGDMNIDTRQLCDPDSLWKRKKSHRLSCGRVTALGKFETDLEPEPDKNGFNLRSVMKKFVSLDEDKKKEDMAWQVAEMIVKDITSVTLKRDCQDSL